MSAKDQVNAQLLQHKYGTGSGSARLQLR